MGTVTGHVLAALERAEDVPIAEARPPAAPGWYTLQLDGRETLLFVGESADLAARVDWHRERLRERPTVNSNRVFVRWAGAGPILGPQAAERRCRTAVEAVLVALLRPIWDGDGVAAVRPLGP